MSKFSFAQREEDTGSSEAQIALFSERIKHLTQHLKVHKKDHATRTGLLKLVGKRRKLLKYLEDTDIVRYRKVLSSMSLRK